MIGVIISVTPAVSDVTDVDCPQTGFLIKALNSSERKKFDYDCLHRCCIIIRTGGVPCCLGSVAFGSPRLCSNLIKCEKRGQARGPETPPPPASTRSSDRISKHSGGEALTFGLIVGSRHSHEQDAVTRKKWRPECVCVCVSDSSLDQ